MQRREFLKFGASAAAIGVLRPAFAAESGVDAPFGFASDGSGFLLHQRPFQIRSGEMHPARIAPEYWLHRIQMAKAMGMNTIALYVIWNFHERAEAVFDFSSSTHDIAAFIRLCEREGMWVLLRAGPYVCGEWDGGGLPFYLFADGGQLRRNTQLAPRYMAAASRYLRQVADQIRPLMIANGGPILMVQLENELGSYANDGAYLEQLRQVWIDAGIAGPFYTEDGWPQLQQDRTSVKDGAIALSGGELADIEAARAQYPRQPIWCGELYPGWLTHWGEPAFQGTDVDISKTLRAFMQHQISFNFYVIHGGTNFGFTAGANAEHNWIQPHITSYDYAAPIAEQGDPKKSYYRYRAIIQSSLSEPLPSIPAPIDTIELHDDAKLTPTLFASLWDNLPAPRNTPTPLSFEVLGQSNGLVLYRKHWPDQISGALATADLHDYATVFVDEKYIGGYSRIRLDAAYAQRRKLFESGEPWPLVSRSEAPVLDILVESMGHINYGALLGDQKGLFKPVTLYDRHNLSQRTEILNWETFLLPMDAAYIATLRARVSNPRRPGLFFRLHIELDRIGDTFIDLRRWSKGMIWVNGHNLGRYWDIGPQHRLFCPAPWLKLGINEIVIFDLHQLVAVPLSFERTLR